MDNWLLVSNCNTFGLANSLRLLTNGIKIDHADYWSFRNKLDDYKQTLSQYAKVIIHPDINGLAYDFSALDNLSKIPSIKFDAYHPDLCTVVARGAMLDSPLGPFHSMIVLAAYQAGYDVQTTTALFRRDVFERCGYFTRWEIERDQLLKTFINHGLDISGKFRVWTRGDCFMYGINHSKARPIHDIAQLFLEKCGIEPNCTDLVPADVMTSGACYPVYPEIGEVFGVRGSYMFKVPQEYKQISLEQFIEQSFGIYSRLAPDPFLPEVQYTNRHNLVKSVLMEALH
ncbi:WcbI family polysaccharide biosynthesis putative acetyltransferase [Phyllobacterium sp. CCNWLW109]|uniref:WcbI family polysaccharide biosynthesis putative acetyltransferase n=1 Tax=Phyllobacterium sp. CCNWLW109 TaxID=3127479 RepID=UPI0030776884